MAMSYLDIDLRFEELFRQSRYYETVNQYATRKCLRTEAALAAVELRIRKQSYKMFSVARLDIIP